MPCEYALDGLVSSQHAHVMRGVPAREVRQHECRPADDDDRMALPGTDFQLHFLIGGFLDSQLLRHILPPIVGAEEPSIEIGATLFL